MAIKAAKAPTPITPLCLNIRRKVTKVPALYIKSDREYTSKVPYWSPSSSEAGGAITLPERALWRQETLKKAKKLPRKI